MTEINEKVASKVLEVIDAGLCNGKGRPEPGYMCVEAAVTFALGEEFSDEPSCVASSLRALKINLNDKNWSSKDSRAKGLRRLGLIQLGSEGALDEKEFARRVATLAIRKCVPAALRIAASVQKDPAHREAMIAAAFKCEAEPTRANALEAKAAADAAYAAYADAADAAADAAAYAAYAAAYADAADAAYADAADAAYADATYAADAAAHAAYAAAYAAYAAAAYADAAADAARDTSLAEFAEDVVQILIEMKVPGAQWLYLTE